MAGQPDPRLQGANPALATLSSDLLMANAASAATVVHSHTWYADLAGHLAALLYDIPHVVTAHSLEPMRPWKGGASAGNIGGAGLTGPEWRFRRACIEWHRSSTLAHAMLCGRRLNYRETQDE